MKTIKEKTPVKTTTQKQRMEKIMSEQLKRKTIWPVRSKDDMDIFKKMS